MEGLPQDSGFSPGFILTDGSVEMIKTDTDHGHVIFEISTRGEG
jgi:hypothetical protein